jgi:hypothetical protein
VGVESHNEEGRQPTLVLYKSKADAADWFAELARESWDDEDGPIPEDPAELIRRWFSDGRSYTLDECAVPSPEG